MEKMDQKPAKRKKSTLNIIFAVFFVMIVLYMLLGQLFSKRGGMRSEATAEMMDAKWVRVLSDAGTD